MSFEHDIRLRLAAFFFTLISLAVAGLSSANACFADTLQDRARYNYIDTIEPYLDSDFQSLQKKVVKIQTVMAFIATACVIVGIFILVQPRRLRGLRYNPIIFMLALLGLLGMVIIGAGCYLAVRVHSFQTCYEKFGATDSIPYYGLLYYGGVALATYGVCLTGGIVILLHFEPFEETRSGFV